MPPKVPEWLPIYEAAERIAKAKGTTRRVDLENICRQIKQAVLAGEIKAEPDAVTQVPYPVAVERQLFRTADGAWVRPAANPRVTCQVSLMALVSWASVLALYGEAPPATVSTTSRRPKRHQTSDPAAGVVTSRSPEEVTDEDLKQIIVQWLVTRSAESNPPSQDEGVKVIREELCKRGRKFDRDRVRAVLKNEGVTRKRGRPPKIAK